MEPNEKGMGGFCHGRMGGKVWIAIASLCLLLVLVQDFGVHKPAAEEPETDLICYEHLMLGDRLPPLEGARGRVTTDEPYRLSMELYPVDQRTCDAYIRTCKELGFREDDYQIYGKLRCFDREGYGLSFSYVDSLEKLRITLEAPCDFAPLTWPRVLIGDLLPDPEAEEGYVSRMSNSQIRILLKDMTPSRFRNYRNQVEKAGFNLNIQENSASFVAENENGSKVYLSDMGSNRMELALDIGQKDSLYP